MASIVRHPRFDRFANFLILSNVAVMAAYTADMSGTDTDALDRTNLGMNCFFFAELLARVFAEGGEEFFSETVNVFDAVVVVFSLICDLLLVAWKPMAALRAVRTIRLTRLFYSTAAFHVLFDVFFRSLPILLNIFGLTALVFFMYAVLGMNLFGALNTNQENLNRQANFSSFGLAMLLLLRVATGDDWTFIMHESMARDFGIYTPLLCLLFSVLFGVRVVVLVQPPVAYIRRCYPRIAAGTTPTPTTAAAARRAARAARPRSSSRPHLTNRTPPTHSHPLTYPPPSTHAHNNAIHNTTGGVRLLPLLLRRGTVHHAESLRRCARREFFDATIDAMRCDTSPFQCRVRCCHSDTKRARASADSLLPPSPLPPPPLPHFFLPRSRPPRAVRRGAQAPSALGQQGRRGAVPPSLAGAPPPITDHH